MKRHLTILSAAAVPLLLIGFSFGQPVSPNYRWCADTRAGMKCFASETSCKAAIRGAWCEPRLVAEPPPRGPQRSR